MVTWPRDRFGMPTPFLDQSLRAMSCRVQAVQSWGRGFVNASALGEHSRLRAGLLTEGSGPIPGVGGADAAIISENRFRIPFKWKASSALTAVVVRIEKAFAGVRPEDAALNAVYIGGVEL